MNNYNLVIIENKQCDSYLNLSKESFYDKLWEWTYDDDLWDFIDEYNRYPSDDELLTFIIENIFHRYEDDDVDCFAFISVDNKVKEYEIDDDLFHFIRHKIKEHNERN